MKEIKPLHRKEVLVFGWGTMGKGKLDKGTIETLDLSKPQALEQVLHQSSIAEPGLEQWCGEAFNAAIWNPLFTKFGFKPEQITEVAFWCEVSTELLNVFAVFKVGKKWYTVTSWMNELRQPQSAGSNLNKALDEAWEFLEEQRDDWIDDWEQGTAKEREKRPLIDCEKAFTECTFTSPAGYKHPPANAPELTV